MAIRYSGDTEIRVAWDRKLRVYKGTVRDPYLRWRGEYKPRFALIEPSRTTPEDYDEAALKLLSLASHWARESRRYFDIAETSKGITLLRVFQAPCPVRYKRR